MGKSKNNFNLFESYLASGLASSSSTDIEYVPLPDSMARKEHNWSEEQISSDIQVLECNRLYYISELRELSNGSWKTIELLPLVKDLLRNALDPVAEKRKDDKRDKKKDKKKYKKDKKEKKEKRDKKDKKKLGSPILTNGPIFVDEPASFDIPQDPETIRNTIRNSSVDLTTNESLAFPKKSAPTKSVSFSEEDKKDNSRPIKVVSNNRIRVRTNNNSVFECDRYCPHKKVDLATWGQVMGDSVVCTKHNWNFPMQGMSAKGRSLNPCQVNDW
ncbi:hypothetical protein CU098_013710 [Rhizopus stolonifer]|uniref:Rieske domain-containing protein n=1 Tax=Rhizopus stolonifer TaxID=4846 RepID=A0A367KWX0_RHIST|nr:hypothetical protein CU098_013710 [Rhizopus stolonifer]